MDLDVDESIRSGNVEFTPRRSTEVSSTPLKPMIFRRAAIFTSNTKETAIMVEDSNDDSIGGKKPTNPTAIRRAAPIPPVNPILTRSVPYVDLTADSDDETPSGLGARQLPTTVSNSLSRVEQALRDEILRQKRTWRRDKIQQDRWSRARSLHSGNGQTWSPNLHRHLREV